ncbi:MAG: hypothetical protein H7X88_11980 [Gloeobacteraceae cyanobacterium ES-bin-316]|nr:hypothetical protein [Ferruginibacter sp.]
MKYVISFLLLFYTIDATAQFNTNIYWTEQTNMASSDVIYFHSKTPLVWKDFKGTPVESSRAAAITASGFGYKADVKSIGSKGQLNVGVYCYFNKNNSWVKTGKNTVYILTHEQNHFNISFIAASLFVEKLKAASITNSNYSVLLPRIYKESCDIMNKMQDDYDGQTKNGQLKDMQAKWDEYLQKKISVLTN